MINVKDWIKGPKKVCSDKELCSSRQEKEEGRRSVAPTQSVVISHYFFFALSRSSAAVQPETIGMSGRDAAGAQLSAVRKHINIIVFVSV